MRILGIRFKNINSLAGEWQIDFTQPDYTADGIFAITGPTGAGKTTLLDVICLALYGRTPRLERVNKSGNDVMTRQTGECFAEVTFSTAAGTFRCHWSQHRARKKADGDLQTPKHEISDAESGQIIDNQIRTVAQRIEQTTGMDFERFTQSMMLAQGGFAAFLKASADERAPILEQITGTGIYSDISIKVHERHALEKNQLLLLQSELSGLPLLSPEQESLLKAEELLKTSELQQQLAIRDTRREQRDWKRQCLTLEQTINELNTQRTHWQQQHEAFAPQHEQLDKANRALELSAQYSALTALRQNQRDDQQRLQLAADAEAALQQAVIQQQTTQHHAETARQQAEKTLAQMRPVFKQVHVLDSNISQQRAQLAQTQADCSRRAEDLHKLQQQSQLLQNTVDQSRQRLNTLCAPGVSAYDVLLQNLRDHHQQQQQLLLNKQAEINTLSQGRSLSQWHQQYQELARTLQQCEQLASHYEEQTLLQSRLHSRQTQIQDIDAELITIARELTQSGELISAREITLSTLQDKQALLQAIKNLESQRAQLIDGQPCPLCGSADHPYASHAPDADVAELKSQLRAADSLLSQSRQQHQQLLNKQLQQQERRQHLDSHYRDEQQALQLLTQKISAQTDSLGISTDITLAQKQSTVLAEQNNIRHTLELIEGEQARLTALDKSVQAAREKLADTEQQLSTLAQQQERLNDFQQQLGNLQQQQTGALSTQTNQQELLEKLQQERQQLLADKNPDQQEAALENTLAAAEKTRQAAVEQCQLAQKSLDENRQLQTALHQQISERAEKIKLAQNDFSAALHNKGFDNEADYLAAALSATERQQIQKNLDELTQQGTELQGRLKQSEDELAKLLQQALTTEPLEFLQQALDEQEKRVSQLQETLGGIRRDLNNNEQARSKQQQQAERIDVQKSELERWAALHELIGSADGKKFRNFAQGLTFELMISHANQQLSKMTDRYLLLRDQEQPLDLNVIDHYQAGEIRSTKNLSGGESFIVSLALALGLSRMASRNVRVDSLFLDEGFGTLDEDALDTALETLASLQQEGKLIGVISHVPALKERISTQIKVSPGTGGRSTLSGPGCSALP